MAITHSPVFRLSQILVLALAATFLGIGLKLIRL